KSRQAAHCFPELLAQVAVAVNAVAFPAVQRVLAGPVAQHHFGMVQEIAVYRNLCAIDLQRCDAQPVGIDVAGRFAPVTLSKKYDVGHYGGSFPLERIRWQADGSYEVGVRREVFPDRGILLVEREM